MERIRTNKMIDVTFVNAFIVAMENVFTTMMKTEVTVNGSHAKTSVNPSHDVSGIIALSGDVMGTVVLTFPFGVAEQLASRFVGIPIERTEEDFSDAVGELVNMVSGNAKSQLENKQATISCPTVVIGTGHAVFKQRDLPKIKLACTCDCGDFALELALKSQA